MLRTRFIVSFRRGVDRFSGRLFVLKWRSYGHFWDDCGSCKEVLWEALLMGHDFWKLGDAVCYAFVGNLGPGVVCCTGRLLKV